MDEENLKFQSEPEKPPPQKGQKSPTEGTHPANEVLERALF